MTHRTKHQIKHKETGQLISIKCLAKAASALKLPVKFHDRNKNFLEITTSTGPLFFANSTTPFNSDAIRKIADDKEFTYHLLKEKVNMPKTLAFFDPDALPEYNSYKTHKSLSEVTEKISQEFTFPLIIKMNSGRAGQNVFLCQTEPDIKKALKKIYNKNSQLYDYVALAQEYVETKTEYRAIFYQQKIVLLYEKSKTDATFVGNLSPLHWESAKTKEIKEEKVISELQNFASPVFDILPLGFAGFDILESSAGDLFLIEINAGPGFSHFVRDHGEDRLIEMYQQILKKSVT